MWQRFRQRWFRRHVTAQPTRTFEALLERAAQHRSANEKTSARPKYLPRRPGRAIMRVVCAVFGGAFLYGAIAAIVSIFKGWMPWYFALPLAIVGTIIMWRFACKLYDSMKIDGIISSNDDSGPALRILFWPVTESIVLLIGWIGAYGYYGLSLLEARIKNRWSGRNTLPDASQERTNTMAVLPDVLRDLINAETETLVGPKSDLAQIYKRATTVVDEARGVRAHFVQRIMYAGQNPSPHLIAARERANAVVMSLEARERELRAYTARITAFYSECRARADALREDVEDLVLFERLQNVEQAAEGIEAEMAAVIERTSVAIFSSVERYRSLLSDAITATGVRTAVATIDDHHTALDFATFDDTIARFVRRGSRTRGGHQRTRRCSSGSARSHAGHGVSTHNAGDRVTYSVSFSILCEIIRGARRDPSSFIGFLGMTQRDVCETAVAEGFSPPSSVAVNVET